MHGSFDLAKHISNGLVTTTRLTRAGAAGAQCRAELSGAQRSSVGSWLDGHGKSYRIIWGYPHWVGNFNEFDG